MLFPVDQPRQAAPGSHAEGQDEKACESRDLRGIVGCWHMFNANANLVVASERPVPAPVRQLECCILFVIFELEGRCGSEKTLLARVARDASANYPVKVTVLHFWLR